MSPAEFLNIVTLGAFTIIVAILGWTVRNVVKLTTDVVTLTNAVTTLQKESEQCAADRATGFDRHHALETTLALLKQAVENQGALLQEVRDLLMSRPRPAPRAKKAAP